MGTSRLFFYFIIILANLSFPYARGGGALSEDELKYIKSLTTLATLPTEKTKGKVIEHQGAKIEFLAESNARISKMTFTDSEGKRPFALKYPISKTDIPEFKREALILKEVGITENNNIVQYYDYIEGQGMPILVMELLSQGSLADKSFKSSLALYKQMANGIHQMHQAGYIHGDVKFENAGLTLDGQTVRVIDFGSAFEINIGNYPKHYDDIGTNGFRPAELSLGKDGKTPNFLTLKPDENKKKIYFMTNGEPYEPTRIDTYAFAMSLYRKKYSLADIDFVFAKSGRKKLPELKTGDKMDALIQMGLLEDPAQRPSFADFKNELDSLASL